MERLAEEIKKLRVDGWLGFGDVWVDTKQKWMFGQQQNLIQ